MLLSTYCFLIRNNISISIWSNCLMQMISTFGLDFFSFNSLCDEQAVALLEVFQFPVWLVHIFFSFVSFCRALTSRPWTHVAYTDEGSISCLSASESFFKLFPGSVSLSNASTFLVFCQFLEDLHLKLILF